MPAAPAPSPSGLVVVDKPGGLTSHDVVARLRRLEHTRKVGHAGTLDPMATGVLVVGVGAATRLLHHLVLTDKAYTATIRLGQGSSTDDADGELGPSVDTATVTEVDVTTGMTALTGEIEQVPSSVSAIKIDGRRAHERVRAGEEVTLPARPVRVDRFAAVAFRRGAALDVDVEVECSSGTYVRALARDLGEALGVGAHLTALRRTRVGPFVLADARTLEQLADDPAPQPLPAAVRTAFASRDLSADETRELSFGRRIASGGLAGTYGGFAPAGSVMALLADQDDGTARPLLVFAPAG